MFDILKTKDSPCVRCYTDEGGVRVPVVGDDGRGDQQELDGPGHDGP